MSMVEIDTGVCMSYGIKWEWEILVIVIPVFIRNDTKEHALGMTPRKLKQGLSDIGIE